MSIARPRLGEGEGLASTLPGDPATVERTSPSRGDGDGLLSIDRLGRRFGGRDVIESLTFTMDRGDRVALRGANGSGKTTILRCIVGTVTPTRGRISVGGYPAGSVGARQLIGAALAQERSFYLRLTGHANLMCFARLRAETGRGVDQQVRVLEEELEIDGFAGEKAETYSAGMLQQLAFARALLGNPALLLLDEPTRSLDPGAIERFWRALERRPHAAVLLATHNRDDLEHCSERVELPT